MMECGTIKMINYIIQAVDYLKQIAQTLNNIEKLLKEQQNNGGQSYKFYIPPQENSDWLSAPPGYIGDWLPQRKNSTGTAEYKVTDHIE